MDNLKFKDLPKTAVITTKKVIDRSTWIGYVSHDADDGAWQFLGMDAELNPKDAILISLEEMTVIDPSIIELADLPLGWHAKRNKKGEVWIKEKNN